MSIRTRSFRSDETRIRSKAKNEFQPRVDADDRRFEMRAFAKGNEDAIFKPRMNMDEHGLGKRFPSLASGSGSRERSPHPSSVCALNFFIRVYPCSSVVKTSSR